MIATKTFALIDNCSGFVWWVGAAETAAAACTKATLENSLEAVEYEATSNLASNEGGYHVHVAPDGYACLDGQDELAIAEVSAMPLVGMFRAVA